MLNNHITTVAGCEKCCIVRLMLLSLYLCNDVWDTLCHPGPHHPLVLLSQWEGKKHTLPGQLRGSWTHRLGQKKGRVVNLYVNSRATHVSAFCLLSEISLDKLDMTGHLSEIPPTARLKESNFLEHWTKAGKLKLLWQQKLTSLKILTGTPEACKMNAIISPWWERKES